MERKVDVYINLNSTDMLVGHLWVRARKGRESASFEYSRKWLQHEQSFALEPALALLDGPQHTPAKKTIFGAISDSAPDRWGRVLMRRAERQRALEANTSPRTLMEIDYLLQVNDEARQGALRFAEQESGPFLATDSAVSIPPLIDLPKLLSASARLADDKETGDDLRLLLAPGSSLGGARPKASVRDKDDSLAIAKFPYKHDEYNTVLWEACALQLAKQAGINVPDWRIETIAGQTVLISRRFDRVKQQRIPYLSAMSMLGANDNEQRSYLEIADALRQYGSFIENDLPQLWRRMVFNIFISNTDDHLRNHGFLYTNNQGWCLSPAFDLNPVPVDIKPRILSTTIDAYDGTASAELALSVAEYFNLSLVEAKACISEVAQVVSQWRQQAMQLGFKKAEIDRMASAFEHECT